MALPRRAWARGSGIVFGYALLSAWITWPLVTRAGTSLAGDFGDPVFVSWVMAWVADHLTALMGGDLGAWGAMWNAPIFAPETSTLAYSDISSPRACRRCRCGGPPATRCSPTT
jgi:hypothetical protein